MTLNKYQDKALKTAMYDREGNTPIIYTALGLASEAGEVAGKIKKVIRDNHGVFSAENKREIAKELGDVAWYLAALARELGYDLEIVGRDNLQKLASRQERGVLGGSGDNR